MAYSINKTDGTILATVPDGQIDNFSSDLTLIGKNYSGFGEFLNENLVKLLENFSSNSRPVQPIRGQLWFDTSETKLKVYNGTEFVPVSSATISNSQPRNLGIGDLWYNNVDKQLYFYDGVSSLLIGPDYSASQRLSGLRVTSILDTLNQTRVITSLYTGGVLLGIFSKDEFTPKVPIDGFLGNIVPGFNAGTIPGFKFNVTSTNAENLGGSPASNYIRRDTSGIINGQLVLTSNLGLTIGDANQGEFQIREGDLVISNIASNRNFRIDVRNGNVSETAVLVESSARRIRLYESFVNSEVLLGGNLTVNGNLVVNGTTTTVDTAILQVTDKNIELASSPSPSDTLANGGGIILKGTTDHSLIWTEESRAWNSSEHLNLSSSDSVPSPVFKINGVTVLSETSLGPSITSIPGVTNFGKQVQIKVGPGPASAQEQMLLENNRISTVSGNTNLELEPNGTGNVALIGSPRITGLANPVDNQDAVTKSYLQNVVETRNLTFSMDISDGISNTEIAQILQQIAPISEHRTGTLARILCTTVSVGSSILDINPSINTTTDVFNQSSSTAEAVTSVTVSPITLPSQNVSVTRVVKTFEIIGNNWVFVS